MRTANIQNSEHLFFYRSASFSSVFVIFSLFLTLFGCTVITAWESSSSLVSVVWLLSIFLSACDYCSSSDIVLPHLAGSWSASWWMPAAVP